jgi:hypothetical protein
MKSTLLPLALFLAILLSISMEFGTDASFAVGYGMVAAMAFVISLSFFWLWYHRSTPLALGMAFCKLGSATLLAWYAMQRALGAPPSMIDHESLKLFIGLYFVGAAHHFAVMQRTMKTSLALFVAPVVVAVALIVALMSF